MQENNNIDKNFNNFIKYIEEKDYESLVKALKHNFNYYRNTNYFQFQSIIDYYNKYKLWGTINLDENNFELIERTAKTLFEHREDFEWLYQKLGDYRSKLILVNVLYYWLMLDSKRIAKLIDNSYSQYFDLDLIKCDENEIFVDVGTYIGDTLSEYVKIFGKENYKKIYCYEMVPENIKLIKENIKNSDLKNIVIRKKAATDTNGKAYIENNECSSIEQITNTGETEVETVRIDDDIKGKVTFIKMDIEGGEPLALQGLKEKIRKYKPKLAISVYHNNDHLWQIPRMIHEINPEYKFYLRYYGGRLLPTEYILYAI